VSGVPDNGRSGLQEWTSRGFSVQKRREHPPKDVKGKKDPMGDSVRVSVGGGTRCAQTNPRKRGASNF